MAKKSAKKQQPQTRSGSGREATQFKKGQSGNPGGRPRIIGELRDLARAHTLEAVNTLLSIMRDEGAPAAARVAAVAHMLDRGFGKPTQHVSQTVRHIKQMTDDELLAYISGSDEDDSGEGIVAPEIDQGLPN